MAARNAPRVRAFFLTCNNYDASGKDLEALKSVMRDEKGSKGGFAVVGVEHSDPASIAAKKTPHYQGMVWLGTAAACTGVAFRKRIRKHFKETKWMVMNAQDESPYTRAIGYCCKGNGADPRALIAEREATAVPRCEPGYAVFSPWTGVIASDADIAWQWGSPPAQGKRTELEALAAAAVDLSRPICHALMSDPALQATFIKYPSGVKALRQHAMMSKPRRLANPPVVIVFWGKTGTGKTHTINDLIDKMGRPTYTLSTGQTNGNGTVWFDGMDNEEVVWIPEFRSGLPFSKLLEMCDKYEHHVQTKGGFTQFMADTIFFCSPTEPDTWYPNLERKDGESGLDQLKRRITLVVPMDGYMGKDRSNECEASIAQAYSLCGVPYGISADLGAAAEPMSITMGTSGDASLDGLVDEVFDDVDDLFCDESLGDIDDEGVFVCEPAEGQHAASQSMSASQSTFNMPVNGQRVFSDD